MEPSLWGPCVWRGAVHMIALGYPDKPMPIDKATYKAYYSELWKVLPCGKCSVNYKRHLEELPIDGFLGSKMELFEWTVRLHNIVNRELGKPEHTVEQALKMYVGGKLKVEPSSNFNKGMVTWASIVVAFVLLVLLFVVRKMSR